MTPQEFLTAFRNAADDHAKPPLWSDALVLFYGSEGEVEAARRTRSLIDSDTAAVCEIAVTTGTAVYTLDPRVIAIRRVKLESQARALPKLHRADLEHYRPEWESDDNDDPVVWVPWDTQKLRLVPPPDADDTAHLTVVREPLSAISIASQDDPLSVSGITNDGAGTATATLAAPNADLVTGDYVTIAGATQTEYNGARAITVVDASTFTFAYTGSPASPATGTITYARNIAAHGFEFPARNHYGLLNWALHKAYLHRERQDMYRPEESAQRLELFEAEFGKRSTAVDEDWINRNHGYDEYEGLR